MRQHRQAKHLFPAFEAFEAAKKAALKVRCAVKGRHLAAGACILLLLAAFADYFVSGLARRTFVFHASDTGQEIVEERMIMRMGSLEADIGRYAEEALLGPISPETEPLLGGDVRLETLLLRDSVVFLGVSREAALHGERLRDNLTNLSGGIRRNFSFVKDVRFFIDGNEILFNWQDAADN
ncbi:MAG: hypothetical protein LBJ86_01755 [Spirochaetaceae bacterium]|nr:hypothetical protein [Spirochaetaceae bacterium]